MTDNRTANGTRLSGRRSRSNGEHWLTMNTAAWKQLPAAERPYRPGLSNPAKAPTRPNVKVDALKPPSWPLVDPQPTKALRVPVPPAKSQPVAPPPMTGGTVRFMQKFCGVVLAATVVVAAAVLVFRLVTGAQ